MLSIHLTDQTKSILVQYIFSAILGFKAYMGMLWLDVTQNNPILRTFVDIMNNTKKEKHAKTNGALEIYMENNVDKSIQLPEGNKNIFEK